MKFASTCKSNYGKNFVPVAMPTAGEHTGAKSLGKLEDAGNRSAGAFAATARRVLLNLACVYTARIFFLVRPLHYVRPPRVFLQNMVPVCSGRGGGSTGGTVFINPRPRTHTLTELLRRPSPRFAITQ